jgi:hypothetical protein
MSTASVATQHPWWCSPTDCLAERDAGVHLSRTAVARSARTGLIVTVQLVQGRPVTGYPHSGQPYASLVIRYPDDGPDCRAQEYPFCLERDLARTVGWLLLHAGRDQSVVGQQS